MTIYIQCSHFGLQYCFFGIGEAKYTAQRKIQTYKPKHTANGKNRKTAKRQQILN